MRAVITGCAGFIGSHLSERLLEDGWSISGIDALAPTYDTTGRRARVAGLAIDMARLKAGRALKVIGRG